MSSSMGTQSTDFIFSVSGRVAFWLCFLFFKHFRGKNNFFLKWCFSPPLCHYLLLMLLFLGGYSPLLFLTFLHDWHNESISPFSWLECWQILWCWQAQLSWRETHMCPLRLHLCPFPFCFLPNLGEGIMGCIIILHLGVAFYWGTENIAWMFFDPRAKHLDHE